MARTPKFVPTGTTKISVPTINTRSLGLPSIQAPVVFQEIKKSEIVPCSVLPSQANATWDLFRLYNQDSMALRFRHFDALVFALFARQAYRPTTDTLDMIKDIFPSVVHQRFQNVGPKLVGWDEWLIDGYRFLAFPGTEDFQELLSYVGLSMQTINGQPGTFRFYSGLIDILMAYETAIQAQYAAVLQSMQPAFIFTGHSLGGIIANWLAYRFNLLSPAYARMWGPVVATFSFGAPAAWVDETDATNFLARHRHYRVVAPGDPVPGIVQEVVARSPWVKSRGEGLLSIPQHYTTFARVIGEKQQALRFQQGLAQLIFPGAGTAIETFDYLKQCHSAKNYTRGLMKYVLWDQDTPYPFFDKVQRWFDLQNQLGF